MGENLRLGPDRLRIAKAFLLAALTGAVILSLFLYAILPALEHRLTPAQIEWLQLAFLAHPYWVLLSIFVLSALCSLPVLLVALRVGHLGPWRKPAPKSS